MDDKAVQTQQKKVWWKYILFFWDWSIFEKCLLGANVIFSLIFYILALVSPDHFSGFNNRNYFKNSNEVRILFDTLSFITSFVNTCCLLLISKGKISNFIWGIIAVCLLGFFNFINGNIGTCFLNIVIQLPMNIIGIFMWKKHSQDKVSIKARELNWLWKGICVLILVGLTTGLYFLFGIHDFRKLFNAQDEKTINIVLDALVLSITLIAVVLLNFRYSDQWYLWILSDVVYLIMYSIQKNPQLAITWAIGLINACYGLYMWKFKKR